MWGLGTTDNLLADLRVSLRSGAKVVLKKLWFKFSQKNLEYPNRHPYRRGLRVKPRKTTVFRISLSGWTGYWRAHQLQTMGLSYLVISCSSSERTVESLRVPFIHMEHDPCAALLGWVVVQKQTDWDLSVVTIPDSGLTRIRPTTSSLTSFHFKREDLSWTSVIRIRRWRPWCR